MEAGPSKRWVKLRSGDGFEFIVDREAACVSNTIKSMLDSEGAAPSCAGAALTARWRSIGPNPRLSARNAHARRSLCRQLPGEDRGCGDVPGHLGPGAGEGLPVLLL